MSSLWPKSQRGDGENVLNGIALGSDHVLITGKRWDRMYKLTFSDWPTLFSGGGTLDTQNDSTTDNDNVDATEGEIDGADELQVEVVISSTWTVLEQVNHDKSSFT